MEVDRPKTCHSQSTNNIIATFRALFNSQALEIVQTIPIDLKPRITNVFKKIWNIPMKMIEVAKIKAPLTITKRWIRKIQGCHKTFKKTMIWFLLRNLVFHNSSNNKLQTCSNLSPFSIIRVVESWEGTTTLQGTSRTTWNIRNNLMYINNNGSQIGLKEEGNNSFIRWDQIPTTIPSMRKIRFSKIKGHSNYINHNKSNTKRCRDLPHLNLYLKEIFSIVIFRQLNSGQDQR